MAYCLKCGSALIATTKFCGSCGTSIEVAEVNAPLESTLLSIPTQELPEAWKVRFALLEKAGGPKLTKISELPFGERQKVIFNVWGFLFGPFYYLAKGMWKKAIVLIALCLAAIVILSMLLEAMAVSSVITNFIAPAIFATRANVDYYKKIVLGENGWW